MNVYPSRRDVLKATALLTAGVAMPAVISGRSWAQSGTQTVTMQLGWLPGGNQLGEIIAQALGYFEEEGLNLVIQPGGPNIDGVAMVAAGKADIGQLSSSPSLMLAASQGIPVKAFAVCAQRHPFAFFSLPANPVPTPQDMVGKKIGIQATGRPLLSAMLKVNSVPPDQVEIVVVGSDFVPLLTGQVDAIAAWDTSVPGIAALGEGVVKLKLWDNGVQLYANPYYSTQQIISNRPEVLAGFLRAAGRGWDYARTNTEAAVGALIQAYPNSKKADEISIAPVLMSYVFNDDTRTKGWGSFDPAIWQKQINLYEQIGEFTAGAPALDAIQTSAMLDATADARPKA